MSGIILFDSKEECLEYYSERSPDEDERGLIIMYSLDRKYPSWFEYPEFTEEEKRKLEEQIKSDEEYFAKQRELSSSRSHQTLSSQI